MEDGVEWRIESGGAWVLGEIQADGEERGRRRRVLISKKSYLFECLEFFTILGRPLALGGTANRRGKNPLPGAFC